MAQIQFWACTPGVTWTGAGSTQIGYQGGPDWMYHAVVWAQVSCGLIQYMEFEPLQNMVIRRSNLSHGPFVATTGGMRVPQEEVVWVEGLPFTDVDAPNRVSKDYM